MIPTLAVTLTALLALIAALHVYWALGGPWAADAVVPTRPVRTGLDSPDSQPVFSPGPLATLGVAALLIAAALVALSAEGVIILPVPVLLVRFGVWALGAVLLLRAIGDFRYVGFFKRVRTTRFSELDTRFYTPLCLVLSLLSFSVAVGSA